jgi:hypothetical protein
MRAETSRKVQELPSNVDGSQVKERACGLGSDTLQRAQEPKQSVLEHIPGFHPAPNVWETVEHPACQAFKATPDGSEKIVNGSDVSVPESVDALMQVKCIERAVRHFEPGRAGQEFSKRWTRDHSLVSPAGLRGKLLFANQAEKCKKSTATPLVQQIPCPLRLRAAVY